MSNPTWFVITEGPDKGKWHLAGWMLSAIKGEAVGRDDGWPSYASCPRCFAMVIAEKGHAFGDLTWPHEQWHAATDYPITKGDSDA